ncbi:MAG TPA: hypothetical protein VMV46_19505 [Thermoanaerobaculia bacterium]|nr:hypothetical protein [Thermoanaerobaculia bacterium]
MASSGEGGNGGGGAAWAVCAIALPAVAGLLLSALADRLSFLAAGVVLAAAAAGWVSPAIARRARGLAARALLGAGIASLVLGALARLEAEALALGSAAVLGGAGLPRLPTALLIIGLAGVATAGAIHVRRRSGAPRHTAAREVEP